MITVACDPEGCSSKPSAAFHCGHERLPVDHEPATGPAASQGRQGIEPLWGSSLSRGSELVREWCGTRVVQGGHAPRECGTIFRSTRLSSNASTLTVSAPPIVFPPSHRPDFISCTYFYLSLSRERNSRPPLALPVIQSISMPRAYWLGLVFNLLHS